MPEVLVVVDALGGTVRRTTAELLTLARRLGDPSAVVLGSGVDDVVEVLGRYGAQRVHVVEAPELDEGLAAARAEALAAVVRQVAEVGEPVAVLLASTPDGKEVAGRLAVRLQSGVLTDVTDVAPDLTATQEVFAGAYTVTSQVTRGVPVLAVKPNATVPEEHPVEPDIVRVDVELSDAARAVRLVERSARERGGRPELTEATVVVAGGRGTGGDFGPVEALADALGGAVGATRAAVDAGWYPHATQIGQTGKTVSPQLYVACGISGAVQHRSGMQTSGTVVAVNSDADAPIFAVADFGVVGDLATVLPQAVAELERRRATG